MVRIGALKFAAACCWIWNKWTESVPANSHDHSLIFSKANTKWPWLMGSLRSWKRSHRKKRKIIGWKLRKVLLPTFCCGTLPDLKNKKLGLLYFGNQLGVDLKKILLYFVSYIFQNWIVECELGCVNEPLLLTSYYFILLMVFCTKWHISLARKNLGR